MLTATAELSDDQWSQVSARSDELAGHTILEKAAPEFARRHDLFGPARPDRQLTHQIKAMLDPDSVFAPGRLPGRK